jgi:hypothetical protein
VGDQNSEVWTDTNRNDVVDAGGMVDQPTTFECGKHLQSDRGAGAGGEERDDELRGDESGSERVFTAKKVTRGHGYSRSVTTVNYSFNE